MLSDLKVQIWKAAPSGDRVRVVSGGRVLRRWRTSLVTKLSEPELLSEKAEAQAIEVICPK